MAVLIVDDASVMRMVIKDTLVRYCGIKKEDIYEAAGGRDAISLYKRINPEFVLCDISMPDINGVDLVKELIEFDPDARIIMCTASAGKDSVNKCINAGALDYIVKPPLPERVVQAIEKVLSINVPGLPQEEHAKQTSASDAKINTLSKDVASLSNDVASLKEEISRLSSLLENKE